MRSAAYDDNTVTLRTISQNVLRTYNKNLSIATINRCLKKISLIFEIFYYFTYKMK